MTAGARRAVYAGALHYWRVPAIRWGASLRAMHGLGFTCVETPVPWRVHEPESGTQAWTGERDLGRFLEAVRAAGLSAIVRLGPNINADLTSFGIPDWVLADPDVQARTARGTPAWLPAPPHAFPIPSYASQSFHARVRGWYATVAEIIRPHLAPNGPIIALGADSDAQLFHRTGAFDLDYHPDALMWWREASGVDEPPREYTPEDAARCALWLKFKDDYRERAAGVLAGLLAEVGLGDVPRVALPEANIGAGTWMPPVDAEPTAERDGLLRLLASGARELDVVMAVERDRYYGAAISASGKVDAAWLGPTLAALAEVDWPSLHRTPAPVIALVRTQADARFGVLTNLVDPVTPALADLLDLGPGGAAELGTDAGAVAARRWHRAITRALDLAQVPYAIVDEVTPEATLATYRAVIAPTHERIDRGLLERLRALAEHKRAVVVIGPGTPTRDELDQPHAEAMPKRTGKLKAGSLDDIAGLADDLAALAGELPGAWQVERPDDVRAVAYADAHEHVRVVFVISNHARATNAIVFADQASAALRDPIANESFRVDDGRVSVPMPARGIRMLLVDHLTAVP